MRDLEKFADDQYRSAQDKVFTLSTGTLALSITFKGALISHSPNHVSLLAAAWILLCVSIFCHLMSVVAESNLARSAARMVARGTRERTPLNDEARESLRKELGEVNINRLWVVPVYRLGVWLFFLAGMVCFLIFALHNLRS